MRTYNAILILFILSTSCSKNKTIELERNAITVDLVSRNIETVMPGQLGMPILRLAVSPQKNQLYAIGINTDFVLVKCEL